MFSRRFFVVVSAVPGYKSGDALAGVIKHSEPVEVCGLSRFFFVLYVMPLESLGACGRLAQELVQAALHSTSWALPKRRRADLEKPALGTPWLADAAMEVRDFFERPADGHEVPALDHLAGKNGLR
jgi:hypothetical protein